MGGRDPVASVVVPARDAAATLERTLAALAAQDLAEPFEVIVVDDGSNDETAAIAAGSELGVRIVREEGVGPGPARNAGAAIGRAAVLAFTDADCIPTAGWLREGLAALDGADFVQGRVEPDPEGVQDPFAHTVWVLEPSPLYETANVLIRRPLFERIGGFEDWLGARIGKPLAEDLWLGWRARRSGARMRFAERAVVHHAVIQRHPLAYVTERRRLAYFPALVAKVPELRRELLVGGLFLSRRTASFDLAVAGLAAAALGAGPAPLVASAPYLLTTVRRALPHRRRALLLALADIAADGLGLAALLAGGLRWRAPVL